MALEVGQERDWNAKAFRVGHWTDREGRTGCTVALFPELTPTVVDVRGGAPGTRETDLLAPGRLVGGVNAVVFAGGSAFGLAAADGVMGYLHERRIGYATPAGPVPIVAGAVIYDLGVGSPVWPDARAGRAAAEAAVPPSEVAQGSIGAGCGATTLKYDRSTPPLSGGFGIGRSAMAGGEVIALVVVNALGAVVDPESGLIRNDPEGRRFEHTSVISSAEPPLGTATTLALLIVRGTVDRDDLRRAAVAAHDGLAHVIRPCHTPFDGDLVFVSGVAGDGEEPVPPLMLAMACEEAVERAVLAGVDRE